VHYTFQNNDKGVHFDVSYNIINKQTNKQNLP